MPRAALTAAPRLLLFLLTAALQACSAEPADAQLLLWLKGNITNGEAALPSWQPGSDPCVNWEKVTCAAGQVANL